MDDVQEHRLALVLNGGISLSIWMGGIAYELDLVRRLTDTDPSAASGSKPKGKAADQWRSACAGRPRIRIDVISGTSAGGLNGVFLAAAIARGGGLESLKRLWMEHAQLDATNLLHPGRPTVNSVLNGEFFLQKVVEGLAAIPSGRNPRDVTLITTASAVGGRDREYRDSYGAAFRLPDHRRRYRFRRGAGGYRYAPGTPDPFAPKDLVDDFEGTTDLAEALSIAGRATAAIPGVFDPVEETPTLRHHRRLPDQEDASPLDWLLDGGLLDNAPFDAVLDAIGKQPVSSTWQRTLAYIVPSASDLQAPVDAQPVGLPPWTTVVPKLYSYPGESNLRSGIERLDAMLNGARPDVDAERFGRLVRGEGLDDIAHAAADLFRYYRAARASAGVAEAYGIAARGTVRTLRPPRWEEVDRVLARPRSWIPETPDVVPGAPWLWGFAAADRTVRLMLRSIRALRGADSDAQRVHDDQRSDLHGLTEQIHAARAAVRARLAVLPLGDADAESVATTMHDLYNELGIPAVLGTIVKTAAGLAAEAWSTTPETALRAALSLEVVNGAPGLPVDYTPTPIFDFRRFDVRVPPGVFKFELACRNPADLLYGTRLGHFAAFAKRDWRKWDWMWGRISAAVHVCALLGVPERVPAIVTAIVEEEGFTSTIEARAARLLDGISVTSSGLFMQMRKDRLVGLAVDALLRLGVDPAVTHPAMSGVAKTTTAVLAAAVARPPTPVGRSPRRALLRWPVMWLVRRVLKRMAKGAAEQPSSTPTRLQSVVHRVIGIPRFILWGWLDP